ncbi:uncharacterized protein LOC143909867 [Arctopsyche grandis]|uniref:uncharacterized protein LOC143909867 n=1 Tax=Arctopsyche grandis TaxID=121162 RepID=UPI00406D96B5
MQRRHNRTLNSTIAESLERDPESQAALTHNRLLQTLFCQQMAEVAVENHQDENEARLVALTTRLEINRVQLEETHKRMAQLASLAHQHRTLECQESNNRQFSEGLAQQDVSDILDDLNVKGRQYCDRLYLKNVDVGYNKETGFEELNAAIKETINILEGLQKKSSENENNVCKIEKMSDNLKESCTIQTEISEDVMKHNRVLPELYDSIITNTSDKLSELNFETMDLVLTAARENKNSS